MTSWCSRASGASASAAMRTLRRWFSAVRASPRRKRALPPRATRIRIRGVYLERACVRHARETAGRIAVLLDLAGQRIGDGERVLHVRERAVEDPELAGHGPAVQHLE